MTRRSGWLLLAGLLAQGCDDGGGGTPDPVLDQEVASDGAPPDAGPMVVDAGPDGAVADLAVPADLGVDMAPDMAGAACPPLDIAGPPGHVNTTEGFVQGHEDGGVWAWKGIAFAAPPVGDRRFLPPAPPACRPEGTLDAAEFGSRCVQIDPANGGTLGDEGCLTLNVWSPVAGADATARPVMVFIHGGGNIVGSASQDVAEGAALFSGHHLAARGDVVVVTLQYRLGMLGFANLPGMAGNLGLRDQIAALEWVQANIERFGGDPQRVMIFGESAGAVNTCSLMTAPPAAGLFHRALMQSGACTGFPGAQAAAHTASAAESLGCAVDDLACLRAVDAATLMGETSGTVGIGASGESGFGLGWGPFVDGEVLPLNPYIAFGSGGAHPVPFVIGSNADEMASQQINRVRIATVAQYARILATTYGEAAAARILEAYPADAYATPNDAFIQVATDAYFTCTTRIVARLAADRAAPTWRYFFQRRAETARGTNPAAHGIELLYVFGTYVDIPLYRPAAGEHAVAGRMMDAWIRFAREGDPAGDGIEAWPRYARDTELSRIFDDPPVAPVAGVRGEKCDLWEALINGE